VVLVVVMSAAIVAMGLSAYGHSVLGHVVLIWLAYTCLATRSLHRESRKVIDALRLGDLEDARKRVARIVSRDTDQLEEKEILRAVIETVSENISDGIVAPLFYLALAGPLGGIVYKTVNTMDSMLGYLNDRYRHFGWCAARTDDVANWIPSRLSGLLIVGAAAFLKLNWSGAWHVMRRDAHKMKSPNAGFPESAAVGALNVQVGGANIYFGKRVEKPTLGDPHNPLTLDTYRSIIRIMYATSLLALLLALGIRFLMLSR
jgi:adenosylcobinamide-phosphate synthase